MKTIKQVSDISGISVRMLHYYDKIGLLKPSKVTKAGYRLYDNDALEVLQQILFLKELGVPAKSMKKILESPQYDKVQALKRQRELLILKRDHLNSLISLIDKKLQGGDTMSFKEFDMSEYFKLLETYKQDHKDEVEKYFGGEDEFDKQLEHMKSKELEIAKMAIKQYGSIEQYTESVKNNLENLPSFMEKVNTPKESAENYMARLNALTDILHADLRKDPCSAEIQAIVSEIDTVAKEQSDVLGMDMGENYWGLMADLYLSNKEFAKIHDKKYGKGAARFMGEALRFYAQSKRK